MKKITILVFILALILSGCGANKAEVKKPQAEKFSGSIEDLMAKYKSIKCELIANADATMVSGTTYVSDNKARSDYQTNFNGKLINGHMINDGTWLYTWMDGLPDMAMKVKLSEVQSEAFKAAQTQNTGYENYQADLDYNCYQWVKDDSLFVLPANINFQDYTDLIKSAQGLLNNNIDTENHVPEIINTDKGTICSACDNITDARAKTMCKQRLGCK